MATLAKLWPWLILTNNLKKREMKTVTEVRDSLSMPLKQNG